MSTTTTPRTARTAPSMMSSVGLVAGREISVRMRSKAFLISTGILMLAVLASVMFGGLASQNPELTKVAVIGSSADAASSAIAATDSLEAVTADSLEQAEQMLRDGEVSAIVVPSEDAASANPVTVIGLDQAPSDVVGALSIRPTIELLDEPGQNPFLIYLVAIGFGLVFFMSAMTFGTTIAQSVVEEKQTRIVEILMSTIPVRALLAGKVVGNSVMAFLQIVAIAALAILGMVVTSQKVLLGTLGSSVIWFVVFFAIGFVMLAALYAATASMVSRSEDIGSVTSPVMILVMLPYILVILFNNNPTVLAVMSYVPFSAPVGMPMRIFLGTAEWWEPLLSLAILVLTTVLTLALGSRIYSNSLLRLGARVKLSEALKR
ncbi:ABC transporter permease [Microterricola pindariensis]|uniref:Sodium ABC transporter permease n=1 Tax=Microterricola pindariensis TaxID=478010 RepID=A0ABX5AZT0_9MICO|nr:ABC transporter permease [Microterricola pindariensis]PPL20392.1 sodium ABC transporter permease [Microterricola pindariensis]